MLCSSCGSKIQIEGDSIVCKKCDVEFDYFDIEEQLVPEPVFVTLRLKSQYAIIDTRKQVVYAYFDVNKKAKIVAYLMNKHLDQIKLSKQISK
jgi:hypothetical protein